MNLKFEKMSKAAVMPTKGSAYAAGLDLTAVSYEMVDEGINGVVKFHTDLKVEIPEGYFGAIYIRSGLGKRGKWMLANDVGIIDCIPLTANIKIDNHTTLTLQEIIDNKNINEVMSYNEESGEKEKHKIEKIWSVGEKELLKITFDDNSFIEVTKGTKIYTNNGIKRADELSFDDNILEY